VPPRANWKGFLKIGELSCPVALYSAVSTGERIAFHTINRATGHRVRRQFVDEETGDPVAAEDQVKGYDLGQGDYVVLEPEEIAAVLPESDKTLAVEAFVPCAGIDDVYLDRPYYLTPGDPIGGEPFALIRDGMRRNKVAAVARAVLFRRTRMVLIRPQGLGLVANTLNFDYEVRSAGQVFADVPRLEIKGEMLDLARHIIATKRGTFDPRDFHDRYDAAVADLVKAKLEGRPVPARKALQPAKVVDLMEALRQSAAGGSKAPPPPRAARKPRKRGAAAPPAKRAAGESRRRRKAG
jgi:DNA end-binding protein Ku